MSQAFVEMVMPCHPFQLAAALAAAISPPDLITSLATVVARADQPAPSVSWQLWGACFEGINLSAHGGLYPKLMRNCSFEGANVRSNWTLTSAKKNAAVPARDDSNLLNAFNRQNLGVYPGDGLTLENPCYLSMNFVVGERYRLQGTVRGESGFHGKLRFTISGDGVASLDMVSLMPERTWKGHGLRCDLAQAMDALESAFLRFTSDFPGNALPSFESLSRSKPARRHRISTFYV